MKQGYLAPETSRQAGTITKKRARLQILNDPPADTLGIPSRDPEASPVYSEVDTDRTSNRRAGKREMVSEKVVDAGERERGPTKRTRFEKHPFRFYIE